MRKGIPMSIKSRGILVCMLAGSLCLLGAGLNVPALSGSGGEPSAVNAFENESVLVEAFVVEVNLPALAEQSVSPIGRQPHAVAVADILKCLDGGQARVVGGGKVATHDRAKTAFKTERTIYVRRARGTAQVDYSPYASGGRLAVDVEPVTETAVSAGFTFTSARFTQKQADADVPPVTENWEWSGAVVLRLGEPRIAGATQDGETAIFLLLVANSQGE